MYFRMAAPTSAFGAAGSLAAVMLWVYYSSFILFFGAEFTKVWSLRHLRERVVPEDMAVKMTEEDLARRGIPSDERMNNALAGLIDGTDREPRTPRRGWARRWRQPASWKGLGPDAWVLAGAGAFVGIIVGVVTGGLGVRYLRRRIGKTPRR